METGLKLSRFPEQCPWSLEQVLDAGSSAVSALSLERGLEAMEVIAAAHESQASGLRVRVGESRG